MTRWLAAVIPALLLCGCAVDPRDIGREPHMTPVGSGITSIDDQLPIGSMKIVATGPGMRLDDSRVNMYRDLRAMTVGDVVTVNISMDDKAILGNSTGRLRDSKIKSSWSYLMDFVPNVFGDPLGNLSAAGKFSNQIDSKTSTQGQGSINRSEQIRLSIAAVVTAVLPNGNLVVQGSQEFRVNFELRVLTIAGIARLRDISKDNTISYDKIAEARISYGGRGRLTEFQQPALGQQLYDLAYPF
jgi:flagellar L-ring protein precursor FlgH